MSNRYIKNYCDNQIGHYMSKVTYKNGVYDMPYALVLDYTRAVAKWGSAPYNNDDWYKLITSAYHGHELIITDSDGFRDITSKDGYVQSIINDILLHSYGSRIVQDRLYNVIRANENLFDDDFSEFDFFNVLATAEINSLFAKNREKYIRLFEIYTSDYNPLWNVDGTETETHSGTDKVTDSGSDTIKHSGKDTNQASGTDTNTHSGTDTTTDSNSDTVANSVYPFDGAKQSESESVTTYGKSTSLLHGESISITHGLKNELTHGEQIATDYSKESSTLHGETITKTRGGNIGVTMTTELLRDHMEFWNGFDFVNIIAEDVIKELTY